MEKESPCLTKLVVRVFWMGPRVTVNVKEEKEEWKKDATKGLMRPVMMHARLPNAVVERRITLDQCLKIIQSHGLATLTNAWTSAIQIFLVSFGTMVKAGAVCVLILEMENS